MSTQSVLTTASSVTCLNLGKAVTSSDAKLRVGKTKDPVLVESSIKDKGFNPACTAPTSTSSKPCTKVTAVTGGWSTKLRVAGDPVMLETLTGHTDGTPPPPPPGQLLAPAVAGQAKLRAT
jgi:hypothetical protein